MRWASAPPPSIAASRKSESEGVVHAFDVLGDPVRRRILELLAEREHASGEVVEVIAAEFGITQAAVSQHLKVLRDSGFATRSRWRAPLWVESAPKQRVCHVCAKTAFIHPVSGVDAPCPTCGSLLWFTPQYQYEYRAKVDRLMSDCFDHRHPVLAAVIYVGLPWGAIAGMILSAILVLHPDSETGIVGGIVLGELLGVAPVSALVALVFLLVPDLPPWKRKKRVPHIKLRH